MVLLRLADIIELYW